MSSTATTNPQPAAPQATSVDLPPPLVLRDVSYGAYLALRKSEENNHVRMTYHNGVLELMSPSWVHEGPSRRIGIFIFVFCEELDINFLGAGSVTVQRGERKRKKGYGKEPDECFYFANTPRVQKIKKLDLERGDPPPDLWVEVDNRSSSAGRLPLYAGLGVPEVWQLRMATHRLRFLKLGPDGTSYQPITHSVSLPMLTPKLVLEALALGDGESESGWAKKLRAWVRATFPPQEGRTP